MTYRVELSKPARKALVALPKRTRRLVGRRLRALAEDPRPRRAKRLKGALRGLYRLRVGDYRLVYTVEDDVLRVLVLHLGDRRDVYDQAERSH